MHKKRLITPKYFILIFFLLSCSAHAGGDVASGLISDFSQFGNIIRFTFTQTGDHRFLLRQDCPVLTVHIVSPRRSWAARLTFDFIDGLDGSHPSAADTAHAARILQRAANTASMLKFGYIGSGLWRDIAQPCLFHGTGLLGEAATVFVYQDNRRHLYPHLHPSPWSQP